MKQFAQRQFRELWKKIKCRHK